MSQKFVSLKLVSAAAGAAIDATVYVKDKCRVVSAVVSPDVAATANGTNYATLTLSANDGAGGSFAAIATAQTTATVSHAVGTAIPFVITDDEVAAGSCIKIAKTYAASGVAVAVTVSLVLEKLN